MERELLLLHKDAEQYADEIFLRLSGVSREEWLEQEVIREKISFETALTRYRHSCDAAIRCYRQFRDEDEAKFQSFVQTMEGLA
jgi:hypothetical protein